MPKPRTTTRKLAEEAGVELDEALVKLWDAGIGTVTGPDDAVPKGQLNVARRSLGLPSAKDHISPSYWRRRFRMDRAEFAELLAELDIKMPEAARRLPKGATKKLKAEARDRGILAPAETAAAPRGTAPSPAPSIEWHQVGRVQEVWLPREADIEAIHKALVDDFNQTRDPINPPGLRCRNLLASAVTRPATALDDYRKYPTPEMAGAALLHSLVHNHPFHNGNKRTALVSMLVLLDGNRLMITCDEQELFKFVLQVAQHRILKQSARNLADAEALEIARWIHKNSRLIERGSRPLAWRRLKRILAQYGCEFDFAGSVGNRINITRVVERPRSLLGLVRLPAKRETLRTQVAYSDDGRDAAKNTVARIRKDLELDEPHGIDTRSFCDEHPCVASDFILRYRRILRRLARL